MRRHHIHQCPEPPPSHDLQPGPSKSTKSKSLSLDESSLLIFSDRLLYGTPFSEDPSFVTQGLPALEADGGTALSDHLYLALKRLEARLGRRVIVFLSDGVDSHSALSMQEVAWLAQRSRALISWIQTDPRDDQLGISSSCKNPDQYREEYELLTRTVLESGGRIVTLERIEETTSAVREIVQELREQYALSYYPSTRRNDGSYHSVKVRVDQPDTQVRTRGGYIDY